jgi:hypothetical protein
MAGATPSSSVTAASSTSQTPSPDPSSSPAATCRPSLVLPHPPAPVSVTRRQDATRARTSDSSRSRPMNAASWAGRLLRSAGLPSERSGGNSACRPAAWSWKTRSGRPRSFSRCTPRSASAAPGGSASRTSAAAVPDTKTWPPYPAAATRAARCTSRPTRPAAVFSASPVCTPIRTRTCSPAGQACAARARCICITAAMHAVGEENTAKNASPWVSTSLPVVSGQPRPDQRVVAGQQLRVQTFPQPPEQGRRALNVGKQERECLHRQSLGSQPRPATGRQP